MLTRDDESHACHFPHKAGPFVPMLSSGFGFFSLPYDLQLPVVKKLTFQEFYRLSRCGRLAYELCYSRKFKLSFPVDEISISQSKEEVLIGQSLIPLTEVLATPAKIQAALIIVKDTLFEKQFRELRSALNAEKASAQKMVIVKKPDCEPDTLASLIKALRVTKLETHVNLGAAFFEHDVFLELEDIGLQCCSCNCMVHFQVKRAILITQPERTVAQLVMAKHVEEEWASKGGHLVAY